MRNFTALLALCVFSAGAVYATESQPATGIVAIRAVSAGRSVPIHSGSSVDYDAVIAVDLAQRISSAADFAYSITAADGSPLSSSPYLAGYGREVEITANHKRPGVTYTVAITAPITYSFTFTTPANVRIPAPIRRAPSAYFYGTLEHPFPFSLGSLECSDYACNGGTAALKPSSQAQVDLLCRAHLGYVRMEYVASQILTKNGKTLLPSPNFVQQDAIVDALAKCGITEMPIVEQYDAGPVLAGGKGQSTPFASPADYANFAKAVAEHVVSKYPQITRIELFNEPNNHGWGTFPVDGSYATTDESGAEASVYMKAAYAAVKSVAPHMTVVGPALATGGHHTDSRKFLATMLANGCGPGTCYDVLSVHNYDWESPAVERKSEATFGIYKQLQRILAGNGHPGVHVMLTEWGFSTADGPYGFDPKVQARYIAIGFNEMLADPTVDGVTYVNVMNTSCRPSCADDFWGRTALTEPDGTALPGYDTLREFTSYSGR